MTNNSKEKLPRKRRNDKHFITFKYRVASKKKKRKIIRKRRKKENSFSHAKQVAMLNNSATVSFVPVILP